MVYRFESFRDDKLINTCSSSMIPESSTSFYESPTLMCELYTFSQIQSYLTITKEIMMVLTTPWTTYLLSVKQCGIYLVIHKVHPVQYYERVYSTYQTKCCLITTTNISLQLYDTGWIAFDHSKRYITNLLAWVCQSNGVVCLLRLITNRWCNGPHFFKTLGPMVLLPEDLSGSRE